MPRSPKPNHVGFQRPDDLNGMLGRRCPTSGHLMTKVGTETGDDYG